MALLPRFITPFYDVAFRLARVGFDPTLRYLPLKRRSQLLNPVNSTDKMQNASGLWGKVKSQAQAAGSMAQGAINVSLPTTVRISYPSLIAVQNGSQRAATGGSGLMQSFSLPGESQKAAKILKSFLGE